MQQEQENIVKHHLSLIHGEEIFNELTNKSEELSNIIADLCQEAKVGNAMKKIQDLMALKDQHRWLRTQNSS